MLHLFTSLKFDTSIILILALIFVLVYEIINGFHDTSNAIATIIYTGSMHSWMAIILSGIFNFIGVTTSGLGVAYAIVHLLPTDLLLNIDSNHVVVMMLSILLAAISWNLSTWYFGIPSSSSHTLIGSIIGATVTHAIINHHSLTEAINLSKLIEILLSLVISPVIGLSLSGLFTLLLKNFGENTYKNSSRFLKQKKNSFKNQNKPPFWIRIALIVSSAGVSFSHGSNDGQKGIGLIMLILIGVAPSYFIINTNANKFDINQTINAVNHFQKYYEKNFYVFNQSSFSEKRIILKDKDKNLESSEKEKSICNSLNTIYPINQITKILENFKNFHLLGKRESIDIRNFLVCISDNIEKIIKMNKLSREDKNFLENLQTDLLRMVEYAPKWIIIVVALSLSLGTMIGWKRITTTIGEKIGKKNVNYIQGLSTQITTALSIGIASYTGTPVSTTHLVSSAVTGAMLAEGCGLQRKTVKGIILTWIMTFPIALILSGSFYLLALKINQLF